MASKRNYKVKGTKDFLVLAGIFFFLCIWAIKDAWYPSPGVIEKHPQEVVASFSIDGSVGKVVVAEGDTVGEGQLIAELRRSSIQKAFDDSKEEYSEAKKSFSKLDLAVRNAAKDGTTEQGLAVMKKSLSDAQAAMDLALEKVNVERTNLDSTELKSPSKGLITKVVAPVHTMVAAEEAVVLIDPQDHFYLFNKSLAIFSFIAFWVFLGIHVLAR